MGQTLTTAARLSCPHGGTVTILSSNVRADAGAAIARASDTFTVAGCAFTLPGPKPSPCVRVQWLVPDARVQAAGAPTLSRDSIGLCLSADSIPQGMVTVSSTQTRVSST